MGVEVAVRSLARLAGVGVAVSLGLCALILAAATRWNGSDLGLFLEAGHRFAVGSNPHGACFVDVGCYRGSLPFTVIMALLPNGPILFLAWRVASLAVLAIALRGVANTLAVAILAPAVVIDLAAANVTCFAVAAMISLLRWPSVRSASALMFVFVLTPKPTFVPILVWAFVNVRAARLPILALGVVSLLTLLEPGYVGALLQANLVAGAVISPFVRLPAPVTIAIVCIGIGMTVAALRHPQLLGPASVLVSGYWFAYVFAPLVLVALPLTRMPPRFEAQVTGERRTELP